MVNYADNWLTEPEAIREARVRAQDSGLECVSPAVAAVLTFLTASVSAQAVVEVGTGTGVSSAALLAGLALPSRYPTTDTCSGRR